MFLIHGSEPPHPASNSCHHVSYPDHAPHMRTLVRSIVMCEWRPLSCGRRRAMTGSVCDGHTERDGDHRRTREGYLSDVGLRIYRVDLPESYGSRTTSQAHQIRRAEGHRVDVRKSLH